MVRWWYFPLFQKRWDLSVYNNALLLHNQVVICFQPGAPLENKTQQNDSHFVWDEATSKELSTLVGVGDQIIDFQLDYKSVNSQYS